MGNSYRKTHSKTYDLRTHFKKQLRKRFGVKLNRFGLRELHDEFHARSVHVRKETNMKYWYYLKHNSMDLFILYDKHRAEFITVYTTKIMIDSSLLKGIEFDPQTFLKDPS